MLVAGLATFGGHHAHREQFIALAEAHAGDARRRATHRTHLFVVGTEADRLAEPGDEQHVVAGVHQLGADQLIVVGTEVHRDEARLAR